MFWVFYFLNEVLEGDGSILPISITCASLALADAGIELFDTVVSCSSLLYEKDLLIDGTENEEKYSKSSLIVSYMPNSNEITQITQLGEMTYSDSIEATSLCIEGCKKLFDLIKKNSF
jgi:exosome complex component MTR3